jgi:hypothetical protein
MEEKNINYKSYIEEQISKSISYSDYICDELDKTIDYADYLSDKLESEVFLVKLHTDMNLSDIIEMYDLSEKDLHKLSIVKLKVRDYKINLLLKQD